ncbi:HepT-like ribonuclease domain-containing protein [Larkinella soli]|uniref:HepT-like ribonuclease domain-containing protein n=1 Tax=Larkinella soli TaxID=1770527 RepID=UPI000FFB3305|nr:HepT-like ribonuclease domain-containing protein [Larkinella soli]
MRQDSKNDLVYCLRVLEAIGKIRLYAKDFEDPYSFFQANDQKEFNACLLQLIHIGEQSNRISEATKGRYREIPWNQIRGFRNLIAHDYVGIDKLIVFDLIRFHLDELRQSMAHLIRTEVQRGRVFRKGIRSVEK